MVQMSDFDGPGLGYACLVSAGGLLGYAKARSVPSLVAGLGFGALAVFGAYTYGKDRNPWPLLATSTLLGGIMGKKFAASGKVMPAGLIAGLSLCLAVRLALPLI